jgi:hypothetical protein
MGTGVLGGMLLATFVATLFIPMFFELFARKREQRRAKPAPLVEEKTA